MERHEESLTGNGGVNIIYDTWTPSREPPGSAPPRGILVISHGLGEHGRRYDHVAERLGGPGPIVVVPGHPRPGPSGGPRARLKRFAPYTHHLRQVFVQARQPGPP